MPVAETSRWAYETVALTERQGQVMRAIDTLGECSDTEIAEELGWPINCVTGRRGELVDAGLVVRARLKEGPSGRLVSVWRPKKSQLELELAL